MGWKLACPTTDAVWHNSLHQIDLFFIVFMLAFLILMRLSFLPHFDDNRFVYFMTTLLLGIPVLPALVLGYIRARRNESAADANDLISRRIRV
jgi:hypothetical protein